MMNEELSSFEARLRRQLPREIPSHWRGQILATANPTPRARNPFQSSAFSFQLFPALRWGALAAVWVLILSLNHAARDNGPKTIAQSVPPSPQMILALREQKKFLTELIGPIATISDAEKPRSFSPRPSSELCLHFANV